MNMEEITQRLNDEMLLNTLGFRMLSLGQIIRLVGIDNRNECFRLVSKDFYNGVMMHGFSDKKEITIFLNDTSSVITYKSYGAEIKIHRIVINGEENVLFEARKDIDRNTKSIQATVTQNSVAFKMEKENQKIDLHIDSDLNHSPLRYIEENNNIEFGINITNVVNGQYRLVTTRDDLFNVDKKENVSMLDLRMKEFFTDSHIKKVNDTILEELEEYFPRISLYFEKNKVYKKTNPKKINFIQKWRLNCLPSELRLQNIIYDGQVVKTYKKQNNH